MDTQKLKQLIQTIPDWKTKSSEVLFTELFEPSVLFQDHSEWTWKGISRVVIPENNTMFGREGCKKLQDALKAAGEELWISQISVGMPLTDPEIQGTLRYLDAVGFVPGARHVADAVNRMISVLEQNNITTTPEEVGEVQAKLLLELYKQLKTDHAQDYTQAYREAMNVWDGNPETEPEF
jgi:hypothetical protein